MVNENLYNYVKTQISDWVYGGRYSEGDKIPPERILADELGVSRVTVRRSLELLEAEQLIIREVGSGTTLRFPNCGYHGTMDMLVLVAPAQNPFFTQFIKHFQHYADAHDSLLLYVEKPQKETIEDCLYRLYKKDLHNVVVWPDDKEVNRDKLLRLRALGMNMVFFDTDIAMPYADCVYLDNKKAMEDLVFAVEKGSSRILYIGWDNQEVYSVREREQAFLRQRPWGKVLARLPWNRRDQVDACLKTAIASWEYGWKEPVAVICGDGENGIAFSRQLKRMGIHNVKVAAVDEFGESSKYGITTCTQDFHEIVKTVYHCLEEQNQKYLVWKAGCHAIPGLLIKR